MNVCASPPLGLLPAIGRARQAVPVIVRQRSRQNHPPPFAVGKCHEVRKIPHVVLFSRRRSCPCRRDVQAGRKGNVSCACAKHAPWLSCHGLAAPAVLQCRTARVAPQYGPSGSLPAWARGSCEYGKRRRQPQCCRRLWCVAWRVGKAVLLSLRLPCVYLATSLRTCPSVVRMMTMPFVALPVRRPVQPS